MSEPVAISRTPDARDQGREPVALYDAFTGQQITRPRPAGLQPRSQTEWVLFSPDGSSCPHRPGRPRVYVIDVASSKVTHTLKPQARCLRGGVLAGRQAARGRRLRQRNNRYFGGSGTSRPRGTAAVRPTPERPAHTGVLGRRQDTGRRRRRRRAAAVGPETANCCNVRARRLPPSAAWAFAPDGKTVAAAATRFGCNDMARPEAAALTAGRRPALLGRRQGSYSRIASPAAATVFPSGRTPRCGRGSRRARTFAQFARLGVPQPQPASSTAAGQCLAVGRERQCAEAARAVVELPQFLPASTSRAGRSTGCSRCRSAGREPLAVRRERRREDNVLVLQGVRHLAARTSMT